MAAAPEKNIKVGGIQIAIWANETDKGTFARVVDGTLKKLE